MKIPLAKYGIREILFFTILSLLTAGIFIYFKQYYFLVIPLVILGFVFYFFRDPERSIPLEETMTVSPADGRIIEITEVKEDSFLKEDAVKIAIFLSVFNVHVNRAPLSGRVEWISYQPGKFLVASEPLASQENESNDVGINHRSIKVLVRQVSGIIARRIVCACKVNDELKKGERIGMIKFGSRTELYIPKKNVESISVKLDDKVKGAETILAKLKA